MHPQKVSPLLKAPDEGVIRKNIMESTLADKNNQYNNKSSFLFDVIKRYDHYIGTTNFKVGLMMSFLGTIILGLTVRIMLLTPTQNGLSCLGDFAIMTSIITILFSLFAAIQLFRVVFPNTKNDCDIDSLIFFGDVSSCKNGSDGYYEKIKNATDEDLIKDIAVQTYNVAGVVTEKFRVLKIAVNTIMFFVVPFLAVSLILLIIEGIN